MSSSLSVLLPVHNAQEALSRCAMDLIEVLPELTSQFEIFLIDDASGDDTAEAAYELAARYPQLHVVRHATRQGRGGVLRSGLTRAQGQWVLLCDENGSLEFRDLHKLWSGRHAYDAVVAWPADANQPAGDSWAQRMRAWRMRVAKQRLAVVQRPGYQLLNRRTFELLRSAPADRYELLAELSRLGQTWQVVEVRPMRESAAAAAARRMAQPSDWRPSDSQPVAGQPSASQQSVSQPNGWQPVRLDQHASPAPPTPAGRARPLTRFRDFAWGE